jgi:hypothetical protein
MWKKRRIEKALAASLYGEANDNEERLLAKALEESPALRRDAEAYQKLIGDIATGNPPELPYDLLPEVRRQLALESAEPTRTPYAGWRMAVFSAASLAVVVAFAVIMNGALAPDNTVVTVAGVEAPAMSPVASALQSGSDATAEGEYTTAFRVVENALEDHPADAHAAEARLFLADLAFDELHWYDRAEMEYRRYRQDFSTDFTLSPQTLRGRVAFRLDVLAEARNDDYKALHALNAAGMRGPSALDELEGILARTDGIYLPALMTREMAYILDPEARRDDGRLVQAMESVRSQCKLAGAVARLDFEIGAASFEVLDDPIKAREHLTLAASSGEGEVATRAQAYLAQLDADMP